KQMKPEVLQAIRAIEAKKDFSNPKYMELLIPNFYHEHICRLQEWPDALNRAFKHANNEI
ncbi:proline iminopeptidase, partial [Shewanella algae]